MNDQLKIQLLRGKLSDARNRLNTIREINPDISLNYDIERIDAVLTETDKLETEVR